MRFRPRRRQPTTAELQQQWNASLHGVSESTRAKYKGSVQRYLGDRLVAALRIEDIQQIADRVRQPGRRPGTVNSELLGIRRFLQWCDAEGFLIDVDINGLFRALEGVPQDRSSLSTSDLLGMLSVAVTPRDRLLVALAMATGFSSGQLVRLTLGDVSNMPLTERVRSLFVDYLDATKRSVERYPADRVFISRKRHQPLSASQARAILQRVQQTAGLSTPFLFAVRHVARQQQGITF